MNLFAKKSFYLNFFRVAKKSQLIFAVNFLLIFNLFVSVFAPAISFAQTPPTVSTVTFTGSGTWNIPTDITSFNVKIWGSGGNGGNGAVYGLAGYNGPGAGGGGGAGAYGEKLITVTPGMSSVTAFVPADNTGTTTITIGSIVLAVGPGGNGDIGAQHSGGGEKQGIAYGGIGGKGGIVDPASIPIFDFYQNGADGVQGSPGGYANSMSGYGFPGAGGAGADGYSAVASGGLGGRDPSGSQSYSYGNHPGLPGTGFGAGGGGGSGYSGQGALGATGRFVVEYTVPSVLPPLPPPPVTLKDLTLIGPLTDATVPLSENSQQVSFTLPASSDVMIVAEVNAGIPNSVASTLTLSLDGTAVDFAVISDAAISGGRTTSVATLTARNETLAAGAHTLNISFPGPGILVEAVKFYVYQLNTAGSQATADMAIVGPLSDTVVDPASQKVTFTVPTTSDVLLYGYVNAGIPNSVSAPVRMLLNGTVVDSAVISDAAISGGTTRSVFTLVARRTLVAGNYELKSEVAAPGYIQGVSKFYVQYLNPTPTDANTLAVTGPLVDTGYTGYAQTVQFTLASAADVLVLAYAPVKVPNSVASTITLSLDATAVDSAIISDAAISGGRTESLATLSARRLTLAAGSHTLSLAFPSPGEFEAPAKFYIYRLQANSVPPPPVVSCNTSTLSIAVSGSNSILTWTTATTSTLHFSTDLINWTAHPTAPTVSNGCNVVTTPSNSGSGQPFFFDLRQPAGSGGGADTIAPTITLLGNNPQFIARGDSYVELGATVTDNVTANITAAISGTVNTATIGTYTITYTATDAAANTRTVTRTGIVYDPLASISCAAAGSLPTVATIGSNIVLAWPASDTTSILQSSLDLATWTNVPGTPIVINGCNVVSRPATNPATFYRITTPPPPPPSDAIAPVVTVTGSNPTFIARGAVYVDMGATVTDNVSNNLGVSVGGDTVNTAIVGTYVVIYSATDQAGNTATANRTVIVYDSATVACPAGGIYPIVTNAGTSRLIMWPSSDTTSILQSSTDLQIWTVVPGTPVVVNNCNVVVRPIVAGETIFYRLFPPGGPGGTIVPQPTISCTANSLSLAISGVNSILTWTTATTSTLHFSTDLTTWTAHPTVPTVINNCNTVVASSTSPTGQPFFFDLRQPAGSGGGGGGGGGAPTLLVSLVPSSTTGVAPLGLNFSVAIAGTATGVSNFILDCTSDNTVDYSTTTVASTFVTDANTCTYSAPGTYTASSTLTRAGVSRNTTTVITVTAPSGGGGGGGGGSPTLLFTLNPTSTSGTAPLNGVRFAVAISGTATGASILSVDCENNGTNEFSTTTTETSFTTEGSCSYSTAGTYTAHATLARSGVSSTTDSIISVTAPAVPPPPAPPASNAGGGGGGGGGGGNGAPIALIGPSGFIPPPFATSTATTTIVVPTFIGSGAACTYLNDYIGFGRQNNSTEVLKLQAFLRDKEQMDIPLTGDFDVTTETAVKLFQAKYAGEILAPWGTDIPTGYVYITTLRKINQIQCLSLDPAYKSGPMPTLTPDSSIPIGVGSQIGLKDTDFNFAIGTSSPDGTGIAQSSPPITDTPASVFRNTATVFNSIAIDFFEAIQALWRWLLWLLSAFWHWLWL